MCDKKLILNVQLLSTNGSFIFSDLLESGIGREEKTMKKIHGVLARLRARRGHQDSLHQEAKLELHVFRVSKYFAVGCYHCD